MKNPRTRITILTLSLATLVATAGNALALTRFVDENPFFRRSALSGYAGSGVPVGEFESSRIGDGNHETGALDWGVDLEHFFGTRWSLGAFLSNTTYLDKDDPHRTRYGELLGADWQEVPAGFFTYAAADALATFHCYKAMVPVARETVRRHRDQYASGAGCRFGLLTETVQVLATSR